MDPFLRELAEAPEMVIPAGGPRSLPRDLGHYRILESLGRGGMGEVFRAKDVTLGRLVALKILPATMAGDPTQVMRFLQEAKSASALNHPNIITIYEIYECDQGDGRAVHCIAMELVDGQTMRHWLVSRPPLQSIVAVFQQLATGLSKAHDEGIVHRDLKPDNVMVSREGLVKILDFGLAKLVEPPLGEAQDPHAKTEAQALTRTGAVMGTVGYMSPEQVRGDSVDHRSDIFAFGTMLFEAATGERPFSGEAAIDTLHAIVHRDPAPVYTLNENAPMELHRIVAKCMAKEPDERYQSTKDLALDLRELGRVLEGEGRGTSRPVAHRPARPAQRRRRLLVLAAVLAIGGTGGAAALLMLRGSDAKDPKGQRASRLQIERLTYSGKASSAAISPSGRVVAHVVSTGAESSLWVRQVATGSSVRVVRAAPVQYAGVTISPDGDYVYYVIRRGHHLEQHLYRVPILGGTPEKLIEDVDSPVTFSPDGGRIAFVRIHLARRKTELCTATALGRDIRVVATRKGRSPLLSPAWSRDGKSIAAFGMGKDGKWTIFSFPLGGGSSTRLTSQAWVEASGLAWLANGKDLIAAAVGERAWINQIWRVRRGGGAAERVVHDPNHYSGISLSKDGQALVTNQVDRSTKIWLWGKTSSRLVISGSGIYNDVATGMGGTLVYSALQRRAWDLYRAGSGQAESQPLTRNAGSNLHPTFSPDGRLVAFSSDRRGIASIWVMKADGSDQRPLTRGGPHYHPSFTADGRSVVFTSTGEGSFSLWKVPVSGGEPSRIGDDHAMMGVVSPDGERLACTYWDGKRGHPLRVAILSLANGRVLQKLPLPPTASLQVRWTPDGTAISYVDTREGASNVWLQPLKGPPSKLTSFSSDKIYDHRWSRGKAELAVVRGMPTSDVVVIRGFH